MKPLGCVEVRRTACMRARQKGESVMLTIWFALLAMMGLVEKGVTVRLLIMTSTMPSSTTCIHKLLRGSRQARTARGSPFTLCRP